MAINLIAYFNRTECLWDVLLYHFHCSSLQQHKLKAAMGTDREESGDVQSQRKKRPTI